MTPLKRLANYYVHLLSRLGVVKFSISIAALIIVVALIIQMSVTFFLTGALSSVDFVRSIFFALILTPWAVYFMSVVVEQLEDSRQRLSKMIRKLEKMRTRDLDMTDRLQQNITQLNIEIDERERAELKLQQEIVQRKRAQKDLEDHTALLRSFIDNSPDLVYYRNEQGQFSGCNRALEELTGRTEHELLGLTPYDVYPENVADKVTETDLYVFEHDRPMTYEQWIDYPDGRKVFFELRKVPFYGLDGKRLGLLGYGRDVTERRLNQAKVEQANRDKTQFISTLSHELRTPLNGVVGLSQILLDTTLTQEQRKHVNTILLSATTLGHIFNDIIDLDKLDRRRFAVAKAPMDFHALLDDLETLTHLQVEPKALDFHFSRHGHLPKRIVADATRLRQVLWNLSNNAIKFTEHGEVNIEVKARPLTGQRVSLAFTISDTGPGIPQQEQDQIFAMYYQVEGSQKATGTGIGLAISKQLADAMGGDIKLSSEIGHGASFCFTLEADVVEETEEVLQIDHPPLDILLVEDVELNVKIATALLEKLGHNIVVAMTGQQALQRFNPDDFDLVLLDIQLPDMDGFAVAERIQQQYSATVLPPLVALTANVVREREHFIQAGMQDIIHKPINRDAVVTCFNQLFQVGLPQPAENDEASHVSLSRSSRPILDLELIEQFCHSIGPDVLVDSIRLFIDVMPEYMTLLETNLFAKDQQGIASEAHKIKGAAGSIGLARIQRLANKIQSPELPAWWDNVDDWVSQLAHDYPEDIKILKQEMDRQLSET